MTDWLLDVTGACRVRVERRVGGASRAGYVVDAELDDGSVSELWLRSETGHGPQAGTSYSLAREAAVYRALQPTDVRVARFVAINPKEPAFLLGRVSGQSRYAQIADPATQASVGRQFIEQLATLHELDPNQLDLPELGPVGRLSGHVGQEIDEWQRQYAAAGGGVPVITLALAWLRANVPGDGGHDVRLIQGDTGPGNFMFEGAELTAITDWELAHWGDIHDDLAWVLVRDNLEPLPDLAGLLHEYQRVSGRVIDADRLRYFRVLAQLRSAIGTYAGIQARDRQGEIAWQLIFNTLHARLLAEALADVLDVSVPPPPPVPAAEHDPWLFDVAIDELRDVVVPALDDDFAVARAKGIARMLKHLREVACLGPAMAAQEAADLAELLGRPVDDVAAGRRLLCDALDRGSVAEVPALGYCLRQASRDNELMRPAMGSLADRRARTIDEVLGGR